MRGELFMLAQMITCFGDVIQGIGLLTRRAYRVPIPSFEDASARN